MEKTVGGLKLSHLGMGMGIDVVRRRGSKEK